MVTTRSLCQTIKSIRFRKSRFCFSLALLIPSGASGEKIRILGKKRIFAFLYLPKGTDPKTLRSANFVHSKPDEWEYWRNKGVIPSRGKTWFKLLRNPVDKAVENIKIKLKNPEGKDGNVFAQGTTRVSGKSVAVAV